MTGFVTARRSRSRQTNPYRGRSDLANDTNAETRIGRHVQPQPNGCWLYNGRLDRYGRTRISGTSVPVHRFVYETLVGPLSAWDELHHECTTPGCCNPEHLVPLSTREHAQRHAEMRRPAQWEWDETLQMDDPHAALWG